MKKKRAHKNKGISPLIATVLVIGFVIVLGSMVFIWGGDIFQKYKTQTETEAMSKLTCATKVNLNIKEACDLGDSIVFKLENLADKNIESFIYRVIAPSGALIEHVNESMSPFGVKSFTSRPYTGALYVKPMKIEILPRVLIENEIKTCPGTSHEIKSCYVLPSLKDQTLADWTFSTLNNGLLGTDDSNTLLSNLGISFEDKTGVYAAGTETITITSTGFNIPEGVKNFFIRILSDTSASEGTINFKLIGTSDQEIIINEEITVNSCQPTPCSGTFIYEFSKPKPATLLSTTGVKIELTKSNGGFLAIAEFGYYI